MKVYPVPVSGCTARRHLVFAVARRHTPASFVTRSTRPGARWGHTAFFDAERGVLNEALMFKGVVETPLAEWLRTYSAYEFFSVGVPDPAAGVRFARSRLGLGYDYWGATSVPWRASWQDDERDYCSEKDTLIVHAAGRPLFKDPKRGIHPHDFFRVAT